MVASRVPPAAMAAACIGIVWLAAGFMLSVELNWPLTHSTGAVGAALFLLSHVAAELRGQVHSAGALPPVGFEPTRPFRVNGF